MIKCGYAAEAYKCLHAIYILPSLPIGLGYNHYFYCCSICAPVALNPLHGRIILTEIGL